jgi:hypothetical protein
MILTLQIVGYLVFIVLLTLGGNTVCKWALRASHTESPPEVGDAISLRAGRVIGVLERLLIFFGLTASSWEILAGVVALKTVARYRKLDEQNRAEYFLIGSLASILWAVVVTGLAAIYDRVWGLNILSLSMRLFDAEPPP